jgi:hypothetical protein
MHFRAADHETKDCLTLLEKYRKKGTRTIRVYNGFLQKLGMMGGTST